MSIRGFIWGWLSFCAWFAVIIGGISIFFGLVSSFSAQRFLWNAVKTEVTVVLLEEKPHEHGSMYRPKFAFIADDGTLKEYSDTIWVWPKPHDVGDIVKGRYEPASGIVISDLMFERKTESETVGVQFGGLFLFFGAAFLWWRKKKGKIR